MRRASSRSIFARPYICRFTSFSFVICPSVCPLDQAEMIAARTAALSLMIPLAKDATRLAFAHSIQASSSPSSFFRIISWKAAMMLRASTSSGTPSSTAAIVTASDLESASRPVVISRAIVLAEGTRRKVPASAFSARRRRPAHSETTRKQPRKPCLLRRRQSSEPL